MIQDIAPHHFSNNFAGNADILGNDYIFHFNENNLLLKQNGDALEIPRKKELIGCSSGGIFLFTLNNTSCFLVWDCPSQDNSLLAYHEITFRNPFSQTEIDWSCSVALQLKNWYVQHKFCGKCGTPTVSKTDERAILCPLCQTTSYPNISPAIIVAIFCNNKILLARGINFPKDYFSLVAGYVDIGESIEDTIVREVKEEVGLDIKNIRYYKSQPWPFSGSVMIGFTADADDKQALRIDENEIIEAAWFNRSNLPNFPSTRSIAGEIIEKYKQNEL